MAKDKYSHYPKALRPASKETKEKQRAQRQRVRSKVAQAKAYKAEKAKSKWGNVKQAVQDVRTSDAVALGATVLGRGRGGRPAPKGAAPKLGTRKLPKWDPKKTGDTMGRARKAKRDYLEDPRSTRAGGGDMHPMDAPRSGRATHRPGTGIERAEQAAMTKGTDPGYRLKKKAKAPTPKRPSGKKKLPKFSKQAKKFQQKRTPGTTEWARDYGPKKHYSKKKGLEHSLAGDTARSPRMKYKPIPGIGTKPFKLKKKAPAESQFGPKVKARGKTKKYKKPDRMDEKSVTAGHWEAGPRGDYYTTKGKAPAKGKRTKLTRKTKQPSMGIKPRWTESSIPGLEKRGVFKRKSPQQAARDVNTRKSQLESYKAIKGKADRQKTKQSKWGREYDERVIARNRKAVGAARKVKAKVDKGARVYERNLRFRSKSEATGTKAKSAPDTTRGKHPGERGPGGAHLGGPKVKVPVRKTAADKKAGYHKATRVPGRRSHHPKTKQEMSHPQVNPEFRMKGKGKPKRPKQHRVGDSMKREAIERDIKRPEYKPKRRQYGEMRDYVDSSGRSGRAEGKDFWNQGDPVHPGPKKPKFKGKEHWSERYDTPKSAPIKKGRRMAKGDKLVALGTAATVIGASKRNEAAKRRAKATKAKAKVKYDRYDKERPKTDDLRRLVKMSGSPMLETLETAAQKNKRLNIRVKSAGQVQARKYPPKEK